MKDGRKFVSHYTPKETVNYEALVKLRAAEAMGKRPLLMGPVAVTMWVFLVPPQSWPKKRLAAALEGRVRPTVKPDVDNCTKSLCDGLNGVVWLDDKQVVDLRAVKMYAPTPGVEIMVREVL